MAEIIKELKGHSGSEVLLMKDDSRTFVRKIDNVERNYERLRELRKCMNCIPEIFHYDHNILDMEYIHGLDMKTYLSKYPVHDMIIFLRDTLNKLSCDSVMIDYTETYYKKLQSIDFSQLPFTKQELVSKLPKLLPMSAYHGDLTLDNIMYRMKDKQFILIDPLTSEYNSYVFDLIKLRQDLTCKWFIRNDDVYFDSKLQQVSEGLRDYDHFDNDYLLILMLLRVLPYSRDNDREFILRWIEKLWK